MAILFNGTNQGLNTGVTSLAQNVTQCTLMAWVNVQSFPSVSGGIYQINVTSSSTGSRINLLLLNGGNLRIGGRTDNLLYPISSVDSVNTITLNTWYHVVGMLDYANAIGYIYINGVLSATTGTLSFPGTITDDTSSYSSNLGSDEFNAGEWCNIIIEDARCYHRVLTASELQTIYACRGTDTIVQDLQARWSLVGPEDENLGSFGSISIENAQNSHASNVSSLTFSYTVPIGSDLILVVAATAEDGQSSRVLASSITFNGNNLTNINSVRTTTSLYNGVSLWYKTVTSGESGNIVVTWGGRNDDTTVCAYTLINAQNVIESSATSYNNSSYTTTGLTTLTNNDLVVTAGASESGYVMTALGTNHSVDSTVVSGAHAGALGHVVVPTAGTISGIGFTSSPAPTGEALVMAAFKPVAVAVQLTELSNNEYIATALNVPIYKSSPLKFRRSLNNV